ncbi:MAG: hypothetical protein GYA66_11385 [Phyllobacteriaceae bacterium]|nr:hypothetical protein [Phyllobacteriaceae bacterium]
MTSAARTAESFTDHAVCMAAGVRDGLRTAQFYVRDMSQADRARDGGQATVLSRSVGGLARLVDGLLSKAADWSIRLLLPQWRNLPSPFAPHMVEEVTGAIRENRLAMTSLFTAYFFRATRHILERSADAPFLVLEHRIDAARRVLAAEPAIARERADALGPMLLALTETRAIARIGKPKRGFDFLKSTDANLAVMATACLALLLAEEGKPIETLDEDEFFAIVGALIAPRLPAMERAVAARDTAALSRELAAVRELY